MKRWVADFETTTDPDDCRVWLWGVVDIDNPEKFFWGRDISSFLDWCEKKSENGKVWFHNLKFDSQFIISKLLQDGWEWREVKCTQAKTFSTLITARRDFYSLKIIFDKDKNRHTKNVEFLDSLKLIDFSVDKISKSFKLNIPKSEIDYNKKREIGYNPTPIEINYVNSDCKIVAIALKKMFDNGVKGITIGQAAMNDFKKRNKFFSSYFPALSEDVEIDIRQAYKGGYTYLNPDYREVEIGNGFFLDKNSMYPSMVLEKMLPIGRPVFFSGEQKPDKIYPLFIQKISFVARLKENKIPFLRSKNDPNYDPLDYIKDTGGEFFTTTLTNFELDLLFENYEVDDIVYHKGWKFKGSTHIFDDYMDFWRKEKENAKENNDPARYTISKMYLNSLIGKFGGRGSGRQCFPELDENGIVKYKAKIDRDQRKSVYSPIALFTTAYARCDLIKTISTIREYGWKKYGKDVFVYSDTDSICCLLNIEDLVDLDKEIKLDDKLISAWKLEKVFCNAKFLHSKCYMLIDYDGISHTTVAGMPKDLANKLKLEQFTTGFSTSQISDPEMLKYRALKQVLVKGGVILQPVDFTL